MFCLCARWEWYLPKLIPKIKFPWKFSINHLLNVTLSYVLLYYYFIHRFCQPFFSVPFIGWIIQLEYSLFTLYSYILACLMEIWKNFDKTPYLFRIVYGFYPINWSNFFLRDNVSTFVISCTVPNGKTKYYKLFSNKSKHEHPNSMILFFSGKQNFSTIVVALFTHVQKSNYWLSTRIMFRKNIF